MVHFEQLLEAHARVALVFPAGRQTSRLSASVDAPLRLVCVGTIGEATQLLRSCMPYPIPLISGRHINGRLDAVSELAAALSPEADASRALLKKLPDLERLLSRVHSMASKHRSSEHPESRAIMYEDTKYSTRKVRRNTAIIHRKLYSQNFVRNGARRILNNAFLPYVP